MGGGEVAGSSGVNREIKILLQGLSSPKQSVIKSSLCSEGRGFKRGNFRIKGIRRLVKKFDTNRKNEII